MVVKCLHDHLLHRCCNLCQWWPQNVNNHECCLKYLKFGFEVTKNTKRWWLIHTSLYVIYTRLNATQNRITVGILMLVVCLASWLQHKFWLAELVMWYKCMWLKSRKKYVKVCKAYEIDYISLIKYMNPNWMGPFEQTFAPPPPPPPPLEEYPYAIWVQLTQWFQRRWCLKMLKDGQTTESLVFYLLTHPWAFGSGELITNVRKVYDTTRILKDRVCAQSWFITGFLFNCTAVGQV